MLYTCCVSLLSVHACELVFLSVGRSLFLEPGVGALWTEGQQANESVSELTASGSWFLLPDS